MTLVAVSEIEAAARRVEGVARRTPLLPLLVDSATPVFAKCENLQAVGAFKIRGAYNFIAQLVPEARARGVITYSSGNHAQAVAMAAARVRVPAVVVMPTTAPVIKVEGARALGAEVVFEGTTSVERKRRAEDIAQSRQLQMVPPFDHPRIIAGQGTVGLEILADCPAVSRIVVPVGGGGLVAGIAAAVKQQRPDVQVIGVEPRGAAKMTASLRAGQPVTLSEISSVADGLVPVRPGELTFAHVRDLVDEINLVDDAPIVDAVLWLFKRAKLVVETSGAATLAWLMANLNAAPTEDSPAGPTVVVLSGGNISLGSLSDLAGS